MHIERKYSLTPLTSKERLGSPLRRESVSTSRIERLRPILNEHGLDGMLIQKAENRTYLSGFTGSAGVAIISSTERVLIVDFRYVERAAEEALGFEVVRAPRQILDTLAALVKERGWRRLGFESDAVTVKQHREYVERLAPTELVAIDGIDRLRWVKEPAELDRIKTAASIADGAFAHIQAYLRPGVAERDVATELAFYMRRHGAEEEAFESIVASGPRSSQPHAGTSDRTMTRGDFVTLDFGARFRRYVSDCTRTIVLDPASPRHREIYAIVLQAHQTAMAGLKPGMTGREGDALARAVIASAGYGDAFGHGLGHGVGLAIHEGPTLSPREDATLQAGMVVTIEPGIYLSGWGGVRIEDLVVITEDGCQSLTQAPKELRVL